MNKNLRFIEETARLGCVWVATGDTRMPLVRKWVELSAEEDRRPKEKQSSAAKAHADLVGLICWLTPLPIAGIGFSATHQISRPTGGKTSAKGTGRMRRCA